MRALAMTVVLWRVRNYCLCIIIIITARCTLVQSAVLRSHVRLSVCLSVCNVGEL